MITLSRFPVPAIRIRVVVRCHAKVEAAKEEAVAPAALELPHVARSDVVVREAAAPPVADAISRRAAVAAIAIVVVDAVLVVAIRTIVAVIATIDVIRGLAVIVAIVSGVVARVDASLDMLGGAIARAIAIHRSRTVALLRA